jgi:hypothetical protein
LLATADDFGCVKVRAGVYAHASPGICNDICCSFFASRPSPVVRNFAAMSVTAHTSCERPFIVAAQTIIHVATVERAHVMMFLTLYSRGIRFTSADKFVGFSACANISRSDCPCRYVVSVGGDDRAMFQWRVVKDFANSDAF